MKSFPLGHIVATPGALIALEATGENALTFIGRHSRGDWGDVDKGDWQANETALEDGSRLFSVYHLKDKTKIWIITEAESVEDDPNSRLSTCVMLPSEY
jgi:hypothetical protein